MLELLMNNFRFYDQFCCPRCRKPLFLQRSPIVIDTKEQLNREKSIFCLPDYRIFPIIMQTTAEDFSLPCDIFLRIFGPLFAKLLSISSAKFSKVPFYTKRFENNNSSLDLRIQKKIDFSKSIHNFPKDPSVFTTP